MSVAALYAVGSFFGAMAGVFAAKALQAFLLRRAIGRVGRVLRGRLDDEAVREALCLDLRNNRLCNLPHGHTGKHRGQLAGEPSIVHW